MNDALQILAVRLGPVTGASDAELERARECLGDLATTDYLEFLASINGAEGTVGGSAGYVRLWGVTELEDLNSAYCVEEFLPGVRLIGTDGGDEAYGLTRRGQDVVVIQVPFVPMSEDVVSVAASSFREFLALLAGS